MTEESNAAGKSLDPPLLEVIDGLAPAAMHKAAWETCQRPCWAFGNQSSNARALPFWHMDLAGLDAIDALWRHAQFRCEALAGTPLRVVRQYANGHTYGQGGRPHRDDGRSDTYNLALLPGTGMAPRVGRRDRLLRPARRDCANRNAGDESRDRFRFATQPRRPSAEPLFRWLEDHRRVQVGSGQLNPPAEPA